MHNRATPQQEDDVPATEEQSVLTIEETNLLKQLLENTRMRLLDLTRRNRLLNFREMRRDIAISNLDPAQMLEALDNGSTYEFQSLEDLDVSEKGRPKTHVLETPYQRSDLTKRLEKLSREYRTYLDETGANTLFVAFGFLTFADSQDSELTQRAPLVLIPTKLEKSKGREVESYKLKTQDDELDTNYALHHKLAELGVALPSIEDAETEGDDGITFDPLHYVELVEAAIANVNDDRWVVEDDAVIGLFRFQKQVMWHDLDPDRWPNFSPITDSTILRRILLGPKENEQAPGRLTEIIDQEAEGAPDFNLILDADSSQFTALADALNGDAGLVIEGPPGTGKSQTISNLIAAAIGQGKTVLFVAEKLAALDVVYGRLEQAGLADLCLTLHGRDTSKAELAENIRKRVNLTPPAGSKRSGDRRTWRESRDDLKRISQLLQTTVGPNAIPAYEAIWRVETGVQRLPPSFTATDYDVPLALTRRDFERTYNRLFDSGKAWGDIPATAREIWTGFVPRNVTDDPRVANELGKAASGLRDAIERWGQEGPKNGFGETEPLAFFFALHDSLSSRELTRVPNDLAGRAIHALSQTGEIDAAQNLLELLDGYLSATKRCAEAFDIESKSASSIAQTIDDHLDAIIGVIDGSHYTVADLQTQAAVFARAIQQLLDLPRYGEPLAELLKFRPSTLTEFQQLIGDAEGLIDAPAELILHADPRFADSSYASWLKAGREESDKIREQLHLLSEFVADRVTDPEALKADIEEIKEAGNSWFAILRRTYRDAKRRILRVCTDASSFTRQPGFLGRLDQLAEVTGQRDDHRDSHQWQDVLGSLFKGIDTDWDLLAEFEQTGSSLRQSVGSETAKSLLEDWAAHLEETNQAIDAIDRALETICAFRDDTGFPDGLWNRPVSQIAATLQPHKERLVDAADALAAEGIYASALLDDAMAAARDQFPKSQRLKRTIEAHRHFEDLLAHVWAGASTDRTSLAGTIEWVESTLTTLVHSRILLRWIVADEYSPDADRLQLTKSITAAIVSSISSISNTLAEVGELDADTWLRTDTSTLAQVHGHLRDCVANAGQLLPLQQWHRTADDLREIGLSDLLDSLEHDLLKGDQLAVAFDVTIHDRAMQLLVEKNEELRDFTRTGYEALRERFAKADRRLLRAAGDEVIRTALQRQPPRGVSSGRVGDLTEMGLINHELKLKKRHRPIRYLVQKAGRALQALKPCFLMSPMSVAQFLPPGELKFDLVVMDEASQIRPEDALGAIARGSNCIIVGDPKQLPPTTFFDFVSEANEDSSEDYTTDNVESILDICLTQVPFRRLTWHYRSEHEALIQFSNERFYENDLHVFPTPRTNARDLGVHVTYVDEPSYRRGGHNRGEARVVVRKILETLHRFPTATIGAVAMNKRQAEEIETLLEWAGRENPLIDEMINQLTEPLFVKNLENVQGDERDVIVLSTTYGPQQAGGPVTQRFGPINSHTGWRRLNVIATRARQRVEVVTSLRPTDIVLGPNPRRGLAEFRNYLEYAFEGRITDTGSFTGREPDSDFERSVLAQLERLGYEGEPQVGVAGFFIDIGVKHPERPGEFLLGIECDGATYHSSKSMRDRDRLRQEILENKGWEIHRIWSTSWFHARGAEVEKLKDRIEEAFQNDRHRSSAYLDGHAPDNVQPSFEDKDETKPSGETLDESNLEALVASSASLENAESGDTDTLTETLERYWHANIRSQFPDRSKSILSPAMIQKLDEERPFTQAEFQERIPYALRAKTDTREGDFLADILAIIEDGS